MRARHQSDFEWRAEREAYSINPVEEYAPNNCDQASLAACGFAAGQPVTLYRHRPVAIGVDAGDKAAAESKDPRMELVGLRPL